jgi:ribonuclease E
MLDNEPDINLSNPEQPAESPPAQPRRRRAASRPAGPPSSAPDAPPIEPADTDPGREPEPVPEVAAPPAKRATRKRAVAKPAAESEDQPVRAPRKRAAKKAVPAAEESADELLAPAVVDSPDAALSQPTPAAEDDTAGQPIAEHASELTPESEPPAVVEPNEVLLDEPAAKDSEVVDDQTGESETGESDADESELDEDADSGQDTGESGGRRRRRRRGGRRRRKSGSDDDGADQDETDGSSAAVDAEDGTPAEDGAGEQESEGQRRRRRRRRRRGEEAAAAPDDPTEVVVRVREPRRSKASTEVTGIDGSTRMEAKRQRRREGREAGRRRAPILSEAEFLARRESVARKMIIRQRDDLAQIAVLEDDILVEHYVDRDSATSLIGNVYLGRVQNVLPSMEAAFVDIGRGRNAVLYAGEVDWDSFGAEGQNRKVEKVLKSGQTILVQVSKDPVGAKGARLTNHVSIPGRYIVYAPDGHLSGISRKLPDTERRRLKDILSELLGDSASVIVRTAAEGATEDELVRDVNRLQAQWADIEKKVTAGQAPQLLYGEPDLTVRIVRDLFTEDFSELIISGNGGMNDAYDSIDAYVSHVAPHLKDRLRRWDDKTEGDVFAAYRLDEQIAKGLERKVFLPSGGSLIIDRTEAMTVIDVNTGKFTGGGGNLEATVTSNNLEAAEEIVRQLRLRDIGGIIVIDFIDMVLPANRELLLRRLVECLGRDRTRHQVAEITSLGLVQMTRKKIGTGLLEAFTTECPHCHGRGVELHDMPVESQRQADGGTRDTGGRESRRGERNAGGGSKGRRSEAAAKPEAASESKDEPVSVS